MSPPFNYKRKIKTPFQFLRNLIFFSISITDKSYGRKGNERKTTPKKKEAFLSSGATKQNGLFITMKWK